MLVASVAGDGCLFALLDALSSAPPVASCEVVVADRVGGAFLDRIAGHPVQPVLVTCAPSDGIPAMRRAALSAARGRIAVVTEDHCVPGPGWLDALTAPLRTDPTVVVAAGPIVDSLRGGPSDRAAFLCDYAAFLPGAPDPDDRLVGTNTAYRVDALTAVLGRLEAPDATFWEGPAHRRLSRLGRLVFVPEAALGHRKAFPLPLALGQRYLQGRHHAAWRWGGRSLAARAAAAAGAVVLPGLLTARTVSAAAVGGGSRAEIAALAPWILALHAAGAVGEALGAVLGDGDSLRGIV